MIASLLTAFYGVASMVRGHLILHSGCLPKLLGALLMVGGAGFALRGLTYVLAPAYGRFAMQLPMAVVGSPLSF